MDVGGLHETTLNLYVVSVLCSWLCLCDSWVYPIDII